MPSSVQELLQAAVHHFDQSRPLIPMYTHLLLAALFPIYAGAHASLSRPASAGKPKTSTQHVQRHHHGEDEDEDDDEEEEDEEEEEDTIQKMECLSPKDAIIFPITAAVVLAGLYWAIKTYGAGIINTILGVYFGLVGTYSVGKLINDSWTTVAGVLMPRYYKDQAKIWKVQNGARKVVTLDNQAALTRTSPLVGFLGRLPLPRPFNGLVWSLRDTVNQKFLVQGYAKNLFNFKAALTRHNALSAVLGSTAVAYSLVVGKPWWLTNLQGFAVSYGALQLMSPTTFATGTLILSGLFVYDIWAVFFTPLMVSVAKNLDVPIKLMFPRPLEPSSTPGELPRRSYSMLGLGDIVLPGIMIALALRFDLYMFYLRKQKKVTKQVCKGDVCTLELEVEKELYVTANGHWGEKLWTAGAGDLILPSHLSSSFPKPYFTASMVGYTIGMIATLIVMSVFQHAQPALLYLVPAVLISLWGAGLLRGELKVMWNFTEAITAGADDQVEGVERGEEKPESNGLLADLCDMFFGLSEEEDKKPGAEDELSKKSKQDPSKLFSFTIDRYQRKTNDLSGKAHNKKDDSQPTTADSKKSNRSSSSISDDTVFVSKVDLDVKSAGPRYRAVSTQQGTAEKHQRL